MGNVQNYFVVFAFLINWAQGCFPDVYRAIWMTVYNFLSFLRLSPLKFFQFSSLFSSLALLFA